MGEKRKYQGTKYRKNTLGLSHRGPKHTHTHVSEDIVSGCISLRDWTQVNLSDAVPHYGPEKQRETTLLI